jgi:hypothetical protein
LDPLASCEDCFSRGKPDLCEIFRNAFVQIKEIHPLKRQLLERVLARNSVPTGPVGSFWGFSVLSTQRKAVIQQVKDIGITVHTLEDHVEMLSSRYGPGIRKLGPPVFVNLPMAGRWLEFNPKKREWKRLYTYKKGPIFGATTRAGSVMKCSGKHMDAYFVVFTSGQNLPQLQRVRKVAAWDIIGRMFEPSQAFWVAYEEKGIAVIQMTYLKNIPDTVFNTLVRFKPEEGHIKDVMVFELADFDYVARVLSWIKTELVKSTELLKLPGDTDKVHGTPVVSVGHLKSDEQSGHHLSALLEMLRDLGAEVQEYDEHILVSAGKGSVKLSFVERERSHTAGTDVYVALQVLTDPPKVLELLTMLQYKLGMRAADKEKVLFTNWPLHLPSDLSFIVASIVRCWEEDRDFVPSIVAGSGRAEVLKRWLHAVSEGTVRADPQSVYIVEKALWQYGVT